MGIVVKLSDRRTSREDDSAQVRRLEDAIRRLDDLAGRARGGEAIVDAAVETELLAVLGALTAGNVEGAVCRAERLAERLQERTEPMDQRTD